MMKRLYLYLNGKKVWIFAFGVSVSLHLVALPFVGRFLEACPTCGPLTITLPPIYARIHNPSQTSKDLEKRKAILEEKTKVVPKPEKRVERKPLPQRPFFAQKWLDTSPPQNKPAEPGGGAAQVLTKESPGLGEFVVGGIPKPEPGAKGPGLGGSGSAPGVGGSGDQPGMPSPPPPPPPREEKKEPPPPPPPPPPPRQEQVVEKPKEAAPPPPPPPPPPPKKQIDPKEIAEFQKMIYRKIESAKDYPYQAKMAGWEGRVKLSFLVKRDGTPVDIRVLNSSGQKILDDAAVETVQKAGPYLPFPQSVEANALRVSVEIVYRLR